MPEPSRRNRLLNRHARQAARSIRDEARFHEARVLMLIAAFSTDGRGVPDLAVLARLDFLLRFPPVLDHVPPPSPAWPETLAADPAERQAVTAVFAPAHYGLWSDRYLLITGTLAGRHLINASTGRDTPGFVTLAAGQRTAQRLAESPAWHRTAARAEFLRERLPAAADQLDDFIRPALANLHERDVAQASAYRDLAFDGDLARRQESRDDRADWHLGEEDVL